MFFCLFTQRAMMTEAITVARVSLGDDDNCYTAVNTAIDIPHTSVSQATLGVQTQAEPSSRVERHGYSDVWS